MRFCSQGERCHCACHPFLSSRLPADLSPIALATGEAGRKALAKGGAIVRAKRSHVRHSGPINSPASLFFLPLKVDHFLNLPLPLWKWVGVRGKGISESRQRRDPLDPLSFGPSTELRMVSLPNHKLRMVSMSNHPQGRGKVRLLTLERRWG